MRAIALRSGVGLSNIYNYFGSKDDIFRVIMQPVVDKCFSIVANNHTEDDVSFEELSSSAYQERFVNEYVKLVTNYKDELRILLFGADGSSFSDFRNELTDHMTIVTKDYFILVKQHYPHANTDITDFFRHVNLSGVVSFIGEMVTHDLTREQSKEFLREYVRYSTAGWRELIGI